jgi:hypothetical protein
MLCVCTIAQEPITPSIQSCFPSFHISDIYRSLDALQFLARYLYQTVLPSQQRGRVVEFEFIRRSDITFYL